MLSMDDRIFKLYAYSNSNAHEDVDQSLKSIQYLYKQTDLEARQNLYFFGCAEILGTNPAEAVCSIVVEKEMKIPRSRQRRTQRLNFISSGSKTEFTIKGQF